MPGPPLIVDIVVPVYGFQPEPGYAIIRTTNAKQKQPA
jgi:hypothetical protein